eukprot:gnl/Spiro4/8131_TR4290_c0_g1_i1.p1 gnl/Spiro4/8131_TR4290_c0_g1~~gnl/Spiro4/8131_TR4290_c0_g1_i1.p1  ORF type:complete len:145 (-),score=26.71 gnl/Spiro4/8131_TR4290_c0_g1_i1:59-463(-)
MTTCQDSLFVLRSGRNFEATVAAVQDATVANRFSVLNLTNIGDSLRSKGQHFSEQLVVLSICNGVEASNLLHVDLRVSTVLPCRVSVYSQEGVVYVAFHRPTFFMSAFANPQIDEAAARVEQILTRIVEAVNDV